MLATALVQVPVETGTKGRITLVRYNGERAKHSRLEKLECSEEARERRAWSASVEALHTYFREER